MARKAKATTAPVAARMSNVSVALLQRRVATLERALERTTEELEKAKMGRQESEAEEALEVLRLVIRRSVPVLRTGLGRESAVIDSLARYEAFRALDDLAAE
jgi:uncharacterized small protein (DUF1192 family)